MKSQPRPGAVALVVGGGPAGSATALHLARLGHAVVLVEASSHDDFRAGETLPPAAAALLRSAGVWERFAAQGHTPSQAVLSAWGSADLGERHFLFEPLGAGWHVDRGRFDSMLCTAAEEAGAEVHRAARVASLSREERGFRARVEAAGASAEIEARFVVDATGRASWAARALGAVRAAYDRLVGVIAVLSPAASREPTREALLLEAFEQGWWYSVPLPGGSLLAAAMVDADDLARSGRRPIVFWREALARAPHTSRRVAGFRGPEAVRVRKASTERLSRAAGPDFLAVGDAAASFDPLSSQGICKALSDGERAARAIDARVQGDERAFEEHAARAAAEVERHLRERLHHHGAETRWPDALFWRRRRPLDPRDRALTLDPHGVIERRAAELTVEEQAVFEGTLPIGEAERLCGLCRARAPAHEVVGRYQRSAGVRVPDRDVIHALQALLRLGAVVRVG